MINNNEGGGLSTISIYNAGLDRSVIHLHPNPLDGLAVGRHVQHLLPVTARTTNPVM